MAEEKHGITVPVVVGNKQDVTVPGQHSRKSVLFLNDKEHFHMVPEDLALSNTKAHKGFIIEKNHKDYMKGFRMAVGFDDQIGTAKFLQVKGKVFSVDDAVNVTAMHMVQQASLESERARKESGGK